MSEEEFPRDAFVKLQDGTCGNVYACESRVDGKTYAIKVTPYHAPGAKAMADREILINENIRHPNIVRMVSWFFSGTDICLVFDYYKHGDLYENKPVARQNARRFLSQVIGACAYLASVGILHRDIKLENVLLSDDKRSVLLCDFGHAVVCDPDAIEHVCETSRGGTPKYMPPEHETRGYDHRGEVWTLGGFMADLFLTAANGYDTETHDPDALLHISDGKLVRTRRLRPAVAQAITACLQTDPAKRLALKDLFRLPLVQPQ